jgi:hypothetical protein
MIMRTSIPIWVWDGDWRPARIVVVLERDSLLVRFDNGVTAPVGRAMVQPRDPAAHGADKPGAGAIAAAGRLLRRLAAGIRSARWPISPAAVGGLSKPGN